MVSFSTLKILKNSPFIVQCLFWNPLGTSNSNATFQRTFMLLGPELRFLSSIKYIQSYEIKSPPWTIWWFGTLGIFSVENIDWLGDFMFQTSDNVSCALIHSTLLSSLLFSEVWNIKSPNLSIFSARLGSSILTNLRRGLDYIHCKYL